jgi:hypothetical protein
MAYDTDDATLAEWADGEEPENEYRGEIEELYYSEYSGTLHVSFNVPDGEFFDLDIPIRATGDWNEFVKTLPKWEIPE